MAKVVSNKKQLQKLVELMERNLDIARGLCCKSVAKSRWQNFAVELNSLGPPSRDWEKWLRVWTDLKFKIKKKKTESKVELTATGGGPNRLHNFSDLDEAVINMLQIDECLNPPERVFGLNSTFVANVKIEDNLSIRPTSTNLDESNASDSSNINSLDEGNLQLPEVDQTSAQNQFYGDISSSVLSIKKSLQNIAEYAKKTYNLKKEKKNDILKLKKEKLEIYKQHIKNKDNDRKVKLKLLKIEILELEKEMYK